MDTTLEERVVAALQGHELQLVTAESCSGGLIAHRLTQVPGCSSVFRGGVVAYSNGLKMQLLGVRRETLERLGAVSDAVAEEMARGARNHLRADWALSVTGIAGPGGGTPEKPVGLVYIAVAGPERVHSRRHLFEGTRDLVKSRTADAALEMLLEFLQA